MGMTVKKDKLQTSKDQVIECLSVRSRNFCLRDVKLGEDECGNSGCKSSHYSSGRIKCFDRIFTLHFNNIVNEGHRDHNTATFQLVQDKHTAEEHKKKLPLKCFIIPGPSLDLEVPPVFLKHAFSNKHHTSPVCRVDADDGMKKQLIGRDSIHVRIGFTNLSQGIARTFKSTEFSPPPPGYRNGLYEDPSNPWDQVPYSPGMDHSDSEGEDYVPEYNPYADNSFMDGSGALDTSGSEDDDFDPEDGGSTEEISDEDDEEEESDDED